MFAVSGDTAQTLAADVQELVVKHLPSIQHNGCIWWRVAAVATSSKREKPFAVQCCIAKCPIISVWFVAKRVPTLQPLFTVVLRISLM